MSSYFFYVVFLVILLVGNGYGVDLTIDENALFSDTSSVVEPSTIVNAPRKKKRKKKKKNTYFNGIVNSAFLWDLKRSIVNDSDSTEVTLSNFIIGNFMLDFRVPHGGKGFVNLEMPCVPSWNSAQFFFLREFFFDGNIGRRVYLRIGKQVLQWGRCNLWNPTDLINVEKKLFIPKFGYREGAYGIKMHIPFGTALNLYGFLDTKNIGFYAYDMLTQTSKNVSTFDSLATALKVEFLLGRTEMAFSMWTKSKNNMIGGYDVSTRIAGLDIVGELAISEAANNYSMVVKENPFPKDNPFPIDDSTRILLLEKSKGVQTHACIDVGKSFNFMGFPRNLSMTLSFYFNSGGYSENIFQDSLLYIWYLPKYFDTEGNKFARGTKKGFFMDNNLYDMNNYSKYYWALFTRVDRFGVSGLSSTFNIVANIPQNSMILSGGLSYTSLHEFFSGILVSAFMGKENTEYTFSNKSLSIQINVGMTFY